MRVIIALALILVLATTAEAGFFNRGRWGSVPPPERASGQYSDLKALIYKQNLDHFNPQDTRTFNQRYYVNDAYFNKSNPDAPVFLYLGAEGELGATWVGYL